MASPEIRPANPNFQVLIESVPKRTDNYKNVFYRAVNVVGFPIQLTDGGRHSGQKEIDPELVLVSVANRESRRKLITLERQLEHYSSRLLLKRISDGNVGSIRQLHRAFNERVLNEAFMAAYEMLVARGEMLKEVIGDVPDNVFLEENKYTLELFESEYSELQTSGIKPLTPEAMQILTVNDLRSIIELNPELAP